jgi:hypothetical protein
VKTEWPNSQEWPNLAEFSKEGYVLKRADLPAMMTMMIMMNVHP